MEISYGIAMGTMWGMSHVVRVLVNRGLISPEELDEIYGSMMEGVQGGNDQVAAVIETQLQSVFADMRQHAQRLYKGDTH